ncbi:MAG TPA: hypothetical protein DIW21_00460 [Enterococcus sp.]|nr:hypothetical protein [Enterococcus sp.]
MFKNSKEATANANHKNRKYSILLLALLFIGVATYGTYAYFTDSKSIDSKLTLTKGQVSLGEVVGSDWTYKGNTGKGDDYSPLQHNGQLKFTNENISSQTGTSFSNVLPGDTFKREVTVDYTGTVTATGTVTVDTSKLGGINYKVSATVGDKPATINEDGTQSMDIKPGESVIITMIAQVPYNGTEDFNVEGSRNNGSTNTFLDNLTDAITVSVEQQLTETTTSSN